jgi:uncharacterized membrane protein
MALVLRAGLVLALALLGAAAVAYLVKNPSAGWNPSEPNPFAQYLSVPSLGAGLARGAPTAYLTLGVLCLVATPVLRVLTGLYYFAHARERTLVMVASVVFVLLMVGLFVVGPLVR